ncbi:MAG TPA: DJ-1/PfpI family protein [Paludibacteraceae bacterium]|jgi:4-methyl-5(b-hydroxyethyl)-thiazole monophosphate biosynthesis|nr:DJ-1/PfpI family protein [Paludibacteraceae bacterium]OPZ02321.1 MAG: Chaperone protein YajL [Bacteroidetes bacterium ADurb.BinA395]MBP8966719.1 DJ-1/PfpI family protein [Paludibacteraceae bacterium]HOF98655.1 DJ-1/PfpI family protein [Paludibacteraceae bacterium]HOJ65813.1 DJ-1/PfpI family protein [Paludibacteraceae bacterium]
MKAMVFLADGFEEIEAIAPIDIMRRAGIEVTTISVSREKEVRGAHGVLVEADRLFEEVSFSDADLLFLPGGMPGTKNLNAHDGLKQLLLKHANEGKKLAAICAAPSILGELGLLKGKEAVCFPGFEETLKGAIVSDKKVVQSGNIITGKAAGAAIEFALKLVENLKGKSAAEQVGLSIFAF